MVKVRMLHPLRDRVRTEEAMLRSPSSLPERFSAMVMGSSMFLLASLRPYYRSTTVADYRVDFAPGSGCAA